MLKKTVFPVTVNLTKFMEAIEKRLNEMNAKIETLGGKIRINSQAIADNKDDIKAVETKCQNTEDNLQGENLSSVSVRITFSFLTVGDFHYSSLAAPY